MHLLERLGTCLTLGRLRLFYYRGPLEQQSSSIMGLSKLCSYLPIPMELFAPGKLPSFLKKDRVVKKSGRNFPDGATRYHLLKST